MDSAKGWRLVPCEMSNAMLSTWQSAFDAHLRKKHKARFSDKDLGSAEAAAWRAVLALAAAPVPADSQQSHWGSADDKARAVAAREAINAQVASAKDAGMVEAVAEEADKLIAELLNETPIVAMREVVIVAINRGIALSVPLIEAQVIERCAGVADAAVRLDDVHGNTEREVSPEWVSRRGVAIKIAASIRALALSPAGDAGGGEK